MDSSAETNEGDKILDSMRGMDERTGVDDEAITLPLRAGTDPTDPPWRTVSATSVLFLSFTLQQYGVQSRV